MNLTIQETNGVTIVAASGRLMIGSGTSGVRDLVHDLLRIGRRQIVMDLKEVTYLDSCVLGELVAAHGAAAAFGATIRLVNSPRVKDILVISRLYGVFEVFEDRASAVKSFGNVWPQYLWLERELRERAEGSTPAGRTTSPVPSRK